MEYKTILEAVDLLEKRYLDPATDVLAEIEEDFSNYDFLIDLFGVVDINERKLYEYHLQSLNEGWDAFSLKIKSMVQTISKKIGHVKDLFVTLSQQLMTDAVATLSIVTKYSERSNMGDAVKIVSRFSEVSEFVHESSHLEKEWFDLSWNWLTETKINKIKALFGKAGYIGSVKYYKVIGDFQDIIDGNKVQNDDLVKKIRDTKAGQAILKFFRALDGLIQKITGTIADVTLAGVSRVINRLGGPPVPKFDNMGKVFWRVRDFLKPTIISPRWRRDTESALKAGGKKVYKGLLVAFVPGMAGYLAFAGIVKYIDITRKVVLIIEPK